jgi:hypothetical protein
VAPAWGVTAAPGRPGPLGRSGPWAEEAAAVERAYGPERTVHVSLEEFARTLGARDETRERFREGGVRRRALAARLAQAEVRGETSAFREAYRRFRALDRPNVLSVFASFRYDRRFALELPEAVQTGPLWPGGRRGAPPARGDGPWVWYASPASSAAIAPALLAGLGAAWRSTGLIVRSPRPWALPPAAGIRVRSEPIPAADWRRVFRRASVRIVTGSRSLLEALEVGGPFLYFNGVLGTGAARRRHRPEKIAGFLRVARDAGWPNDLLRDLADFARGRRVAPIVARAADRAGGWGRFPTPPEPVGFAPGFEDAGRFLVAVATELAERTTPADALVERARRRSHP